MEFQADMGRLEVRAQAIKLLELVSTQELRKMAKIGSLREDVRRAAFRVYTKRTSRRG